MSSTAWVAAGGNTGDNAWQLTAATMVGMQSIPGLAVLYAGIVKKKWAINSAFMVFYAFAAVLIIWVLFAYQAAFGPQWIPLMGIPGPALGMDYELEQSVLPATATSTVAATAPNFSQATMVYFQFVFAAITLIILAGALLCRMNFLAWIIFVPLWLFFSYCVGAFSLWGGGFLYKWGVIDYSGGYVIHLAAGVAGFVGAWVIGPRHKRDIESFEPNNIILALVGAGLLWLGWNGFNGGDPYSATADAGAAVLNTNITTATSLLCWMFMDMFFHKKPSVIGAINGMVTGLVAITPAAGVVAGWGAIVIGIFSGTLPWFSMHYLGPKIQPYVDDCLGIFHTHAVAGLLGGFLTGIFATTDGCTAFACVDSAGAVGGYGTQIGLQIVGALFIIGWNVVWTPLILYAIQFVGIPLRMSEELLLAGDEAIHGEEAYAFFEEQPLLQVVSSPADKGTEKQNRVSGVNGIHLTGEGEPNGNGLENGSSAQMQVLRVQGTNSQALEESAVLTLHH